VSQALHASQAWFVYHSLNKEQYTSPGSIGFRQANLQAQYKQGMVHLRLTRGNIFHTSFISPERLIIFFFFFHWRFKPFVHVHEGVSSRISCNFLHQELRDGHQILI